MTSLLGALAFGCGGGSGNDDAGGMVGDGGGGMGTDAGMTGTDAGPGVDGGPGTDAGGTDGGRPEPSCTDGEQNGSEADVDCGGAICDPCADGLMCTSGMDCVSGSCSVDCGGGACTPGVCLAPSCTDMVQNQDETDVDCGGATCDGCPDGQGCALGTDCVSGVCDPSMLVCVAAGCADGARNGDESDVDCGGSCGPCGVGLACGGDADCASGYCDPSSSTCATPTCTDTVQNQDETDVDCGGATCPGCSDGGTCTAGTDCLSGVCDAATMLCATPSCSDGVLNAAETGIDCGGGTCPACTTGGGCATGSDCASGVCDAASMTCAAASCMDGVMNGAETGVDCGGGCAGCPDGGMCTTGTDCASRVCMGTMCVSPTCTDGVRNGAETGVDCGGGTCPTCTAGGGCSGPSDCTSGVCDPTTMTCSSAGCMDGVRNGAETGVDCGGGTCPGCPDGGPCGTGADCASGSCDPTTMTCDMPTCTDLRRNGAETDIDCGGGTCPACSPGEDCLMGRDCSSGICGGGSMTCNAPTCSDGVLNGTETDIDCGGGTCSPCDPGDICRRASDCSSGVCDGTRHCAAPTCSDGVQNGGETGVDCGGPCTPCTAISCAELLARAPSTPSGRYMIDPDGTGPTAAFSAYCDMTNFGGGWTNLDFTANRVYLRGSDFVQCRGGLTQTATSVTCSLPYFNDDINQPMYHYLCNGTDMSAQYILDHMAPLIGHRTSMTLGGFTGLSQRHTGSSADPTSTGDNEYCYVSSGIVRWDNAACSPYNSSGNGNCIPLFFTISLSS
ncbi:MAG: hypothetical protein H6719_11695 [Sandaracinaceae bacterium]|nr:hypothetical protein [Sandaracinaceae bacterium]